MVIGSVFLLSDGVTFEFVAARCCLGCFLYAFIGQTGASNLSTLMNALTSFRMLESYLTRRVIAL